MRETIVVDHPLFTVATEVSLFGKNQVGFVMFNNEEMSATVVQSDLLYTTFKGIFDLIWDLYHKDG